jgi:tetratricopeptide (TPR) repeat protein
MLLLGVLLRPFGPAQTDLYGSMPLSRRNLRLLLPVLLLTGTALLYAPAVRNAFVNYDDPDYVTRNPAVLGGLSWKGLVWAFGTNSPAANWHPLTWISHMADVSWYGTKPFGHHLSNVVLHCLGGLLLFFFLQRATGKAFESAAVAALFALHPLNVESVAWVAERKAVLCMIFFALTLWAYVWYTSKPSAARYLLVAGLYALALMSKIMAISLPFALLLLDYWPLERIPGPATPEPPPGGGAPSRPPASPWAAFLAAFGQRFVEKAPLLVMSAVAGSITWHIHRQQGALTAAMPLSWRLENVVYSFVAYLGKALWPSNLAVFYPHPEHSLAVWQVVGAALTLFAISVLVYRFRRKRYLVVGWLWFVGTMIPMSGLVQSGRQGMADRYIYIPILGLLIAVVWLLADAAARFEIRPQVAGTCFALLLAPYVYLTHQQIGYWRDSYTLFGHALAVTKKNAIAENNFGAALMELGQPQLAGPHFAAAVRIAPDLSSAHYNLGVVLQGENQFRAAAEQYKFVIGQSVDPLERTRAHNNLGVLYLAINDLPAALSELNAAIALTPSEQNSYIGRGIVELRSSNPDAAIADFSYAKQIAPSPVADFHLGEALESKGDYSRAELAYLDALRLLPGLQEARVRLEALRGRPRTLEQNVEVRK